MPDTHIFEIRALSNISDLDHVVALQHICIDNQANIIPLHTLISYTRNGGQVLGAFEGDLLVGYLIAFLGTDSRDPRRPAMANLKLVMEAIAVHPDYRSNGIATQLAINLRTWAIQQGIRLVTRVFNPLNGRSAYFCIRKLGMIVQKYIPDYYGNADTPLPIENADQLMGEWWVTRNRVEEKLYGKRHSLTLAQYLDANVPIVNPTQFLGSMPHPYEGSFAFGDNAMLLVEIPTDYESIAFSAKDLAQAWQNHSRAVFTTMFTNGYVVTDFLFEGNEEQNRAFYLMSYDGPVFTISMDEE